MSETGTSDPLREAADHVAAAARDCLDQAKKSYGSALKQEYTAEQFGKDVASSWAKGVRLWARLVIDAQKVAIKLAQGATTEGGGGAEGATTEGGGGAEGATTEGGGGAEGAPSESGEPGEGGGEDGGGESMS